MEKSTVWIVTYHFEEVKAGPVIRFMRYAKHFAARGVDLLFVTKRAEGASSSESRSEGIHSLHLDCTSLYDLTRQALKLASRSPSPPTSIVLFAVHYRNFFDLLAARRKGFRLIYVSTMQLDLKWGSRDTLRRLRAVVLPRVLQALYSLMDLIVTSAEIQQTDFQHLGLPQTKLKTIFNGVDTGRFSPVSLEKKNELRQRTGLAQGKYIFLYVGLFVERKGVDLLLRSFRSLRHHLGEDFLLLIVGHEMPDEQNSEDFNSSWREMKSAASDEGWLIVRQFSTSVEEYYQMADAFVFMSRLEGVPNVLLEAMSCALPVVTSAFSGFAKEYGKEDIHFRFFTDNPDQNAAILQELMQSDDLQLKLSTNARQRSEQEFSIDRSVDQFLTILT